MQKYDVNEPAAVEAVAKCLMEGGVAVIPTETVYGIVTRYDNEAGYDRIYALKRRPASGPSSISTSRCCVPYSSIPVMVIDPSSTESTRARKDSPLSSATGCAEGINHITAHSNASASAGM